MASSVRVELMGRRTFWSADFQGFRWWLFGTIDMIAKLKVG
ncbi:hypothetical protein Hanom_Chr03g00268261 [Helianthus anomalus]